MERPATRSYRSTLRAEQAAATRQRVLEAAATCFAAKGYSGTSFADIAAEASVSPETVKAQGPKRSLLLRAFAHLFSGAEGDELLSQSDAAARLAAIPDEDVMLRELAAFVADANARTSVLWIEILSASTADPEIADALAGLLSRRERDYRGAVALLLDRGIVSDATDPDEAAAALSFLWSPESHQQLVLQSGWTMTRYAAWLADAARRVLRA